MGGSGPEDNHAVRTLVPLEDRRRFLRLLHRELDLGGFFDAADRTLARAVLPTGILSHREAGPDGWFVDGQAGSSAETSLEDAISEHRK